jgi:hypothetical protein
MKFSLVLALIIVLLTNSCQRLKISSAEDNTIYKDNFDVHKVSKFNTNYVGKNVDDIILEFGDPISITNKITLEYIDQAALIKSFNYSTGEYRLLYSSQRNPRLDYIRLSCVVSRGKIKEMESVLYVE